MGRIVRPFVLLCQYDRSCYLGDMKKALGKGPKTRDTHQAILDAATRLASVEGLYGLTIGRLAKDLGVSKSGLYAHFDSKLDLQLETIAEAMKVFQREVLQPGLQAAPGLSRLMAFTDAYLSYIERGVFPGGCFFAGLLAEVDARSGPLHDSLVSMAQTWSRLLEDSVREAQQAGEIEEDADPSDLAFQIAAGIDLGNFYFILFGDPAHIERARRSIGSIIQSAQGKK